MMQGVGGGAVQSADALLRHAENSYKQNLEMAPAPDSTLGTGQLIWDRLTGWLRNVSNPVTKAHAMKTRGERSNIELDRSDGGITVRRVLSGLESSRPHPWLD